MSDWQEYNPSLFVDRPKALDEIRKWANASIVDRRVLSFVAPPGAGKTWILKAAHGEWNRHNPSNKRLVVWLDVPKIVNRGEEHDPNKMIAIDQVLECLKRVHREAGERCPNVPPMDPTPVFSAIISQLVRILCNCNLRHDPLVIVDGYDEVSREQAWEVERRLLDYIIERDCMRMIVAHRDQESLQSDNLRRHQRRIFLDTLDPLSPAFAREQFARFVQQQYPAVKSSLDDWIKDLKHYQWDNPFANAFLFDRAVSRDPGQLSPLNAQDLKDCCWKVITRPINGGKPRYSLELYEFSWLVDIAVKLGDEWTAIGLDETCQLTLREIERLFVYGVIVEIPPRYKIADSLRELLRDLHELQKGSQP
ncbi:MAG: hypothetical protein QMD04_08115 [Anaerolineales bacterium]|nr:hypothetical protein [Anaerolineales bacterium]